MKTGVICDGISRDLHHALLVLKEFGIEHAELQYVWNREVGDHSRQEVALIKQLLADHGMKLACLSRHLFAGTTIGNRPGDTLHQAHMEALRRMLDLAHELNSPLVRVMTPKKEAILWGDNGAEIWNASAGAWEATLELMHPAVELARPEGLKLVVETGTGTMVNSGFTGRKLIDDLDAKDTLQVLWDPANCCWCHDIAYPDAYEELRGGYIGHVHIKDVRTDTPRARLEVCRLGQGQLGPQLGAIATALKRDGYLGVVSYESVYHPGNGSFENGFRESIDEFMQHFGPEN